MASSNKDSRTKTCMQILKWNPSNSKARFKCDICAGEMPNAERFFIKGCHHFYCCKCTSKYVASKLERRISTIPCPVSGCKGRLDPESCRSILPSKLFDKWCDALCEALILDSEKFYCPFKDCSGLLVDKRKRDGEIITSSECPICRRLFCAVCRVPWHSEISCVDFQKLDKNERERNDILLMNLAKNKRWMRCPSCRIYIEKISGCSHVTCRLCSRSFNYHL